MKNLSDRKLFTYISFLLVVVDHHVVINYGGDCKFVNEFQQVAVDDYLTNFPDILHHICGDIKNVTGKQIMEMTDYSELN